MGEAGEATVIADSSVLIVYARSGRLELLRDVFEILVVPPAVEEECVKRGDLRPGAPSLRQALEAGWIRVSPAPRAALEIARNHPNLGRGEAAVLALARARKADVALIDDGLARNVAKAEGLRVVGSLGVLAMAHRRGILKDRAAVESALRLLLRSGLWASADLVEDFWESLGGRP